jgi:Bacteriophage related domain of unknown function
MTTTIEERISAALLARVETLVTTPAMAVAWPNEPFTSAVNVAHLEVVLLPNRNLRPFLAGADPHFRQGILQLTVVAPLNRGASAAIALAGAVAAHFPADQALYCGGVKVRVQAAPDVAPGFATERSFNVPVSVRFEAFA